jgi:hypothetical protein
MGYSLQNSSAATSGPAVGGNSQTGQVIVGGNPNVAAGITSLASLMQNPLTLALLAGAVVLIVFAWKRK